jgi:LCP family protein required for cell wall assembly
MPENRPLHTTDDDTDRVLGQQKTGYGLGRSDIDESLRDIDNTGEPSKKLSRRQRRRLAKQTRKPNSTARRIFKWLIIAIVLALLAVGGYTAYKFVTAGNNIFQGNILDIFKSQPLKQDSNGRSNFLILGTSEDDPGHNGANLTDSILVVSVDQKNNNIYMFSVPRDLYVEYGVACNSGYSGKINEYFMCSDSGTNAEAEKDRLIKTQKFVGDIFGLDIQYGIHANGTVIKEAVDAVGGIDVDIEGSNGAPGILDRNFDWRCNFTCYYVKYVNGIHHLDGEHAWFLSMARGDIAPTYGLGNSNFDREKNQQKILVAIKNKAMTTGILTNLGAVTKLIDALGNNLRTNIQADEIRTLMQVASDVKPSDVHTLSLVGDDNAVVKTGSYGDASVVMPSAGIFDYGEIKAFIEKNLSSDPVIREAAPIVVLNGTGQSGFGQTKADVLTKAGFNVTLVNNAPDGTYEAVEIYQIGTDNTATAKKLSSMYGGVTIKKSAPPLAVNGNVRFVIIFGAVTVSPKG